MKESIMNYEKIIEDNSKIIWKLTNHFYGVDKNDLYQAGIVGLLKALKKYDENSETKFSTYAYNYIFGEMFLLASNRDIKISKDILLLSKKIESARSILAQKLAKIPSNLEISEYLGLDLEAVELALTSANAILSLDSDNDETRSIYECLSTENPDIDTKILVDDSFSILTEAEKNIIISRYYEDLTQQEVAKKLKMSQVKVSRYEKKGINKLRDYMRL